MRIGPKQRTFIEAFTSDESEELLMAVRTAGFSGNDTYLRAMGRKMLNDLTVIKAITERDNYRESRNGVVATRLERQAFWTDLMRNDDKSAHPEYDANNLPKKINIPLGSRIKASELLGRSETDFIEKVDVSGNISISDIIQSSYKELDNTDDLEFIEAEYHRSKEADEDETEEETIKETTNEDVEEKATSISTFI